MRGFHRLCLGWLLAMGLLHSAAAETVLLTTYVVSPARLAKLQAAAVQNGVALQTLAAEQTAPEALQAALNGARLLVIDTPHTSVAAAVAAKFGDMLARNATPYVVVGEFSAVAARQTTPPAPLLAQRGVPPDAAQRLREYWRFGGADNLHMAMAALTSPVWNAAQLPPAVQLPLAGFYNPAWPQIAPSAVEAQQQLNLRPNQPPAHAFIAGEAPKTVAIAVNNAVFTSDDTPWLDALIAALEQRGLRAYAFYGPRQQKDLFFNATHVDGQRLADVLINAALVFRQR